MITITGLTPRQRLVAELLWNTNDQSEVERLCRLDRDARIVRDLIIAAELDEHMEVTGSVKELIDSCR
jgi:microcystin degradation protein MlrC